jgi:UDP:flavonoid glycosyltransferase YjiC (YdhE family)
MVPLAHALLDRGDQVLWAAPASARALLDRAGFATARAGLDEPEATARFTSLIAGLGRVAPAQRPDMIFPGLFGEALPGPMLEDLLPIGRDYRPDLVISESAEFAGPLVAALHGVAGITHSYGPLTPEPRVAAAGEKLAPLWRAHGLTPLPYGGRYEHCYLDVYPASLQPQDRPHIHRTQPIRPGAYAAPADEGPPKWRHTRSETPLVYVTFGTVYNPGHVMAEVVRAVASQPVAVIATVGPSGDPASLGTQPWNVHVERYIPQTEILARCSTVVSHGGSGTFLGALGAGVPQLLIPQGADQFLNATACESSGVGIALQPANLTRQAVTGAVSELLLELRFRSAASRVRAEIAAMPSPTQVADSLARAFG